MMPMGFRVDWRAWGFMGLLLCLASEGVSAPSPSRLDDADPAKRLEAIRLVEDSGPAGRSASAALTLALTDPRADIRDAAGRALIAVHGPEALTLFLTVLTHARADVRVTALQGLGRLGPVALPGLPGLVEALGDPEAAVRVQALSTLERIPSAGPRTVHSVLSRLEDPEPAVVQSALRLLTLAGGDVPGLSNRLGELVSRHPDSATRQAALRAQRALFGPEALQWFRNGLGDADPAVRRLSFQYVSELTAEHLQVFRHGLPQISLALHDEDPEIRQCALVIMTKLSAHLGIYRQALHEIFRQRTFAVSLRVSALQALNDLGASMPFSNGWLTLALGDPEPIIVQEALAAVGQQGRATSRSYLTPIIRLLNDPSPAMRAQAAWALGEMKRPRAVPFLSRAGEDVDPSVRLTARAAMKLIESWSPPVPPGELHWFDHPSMLTNVAAAIQSQDLSGAERNMDILGYVGIRAVPVLLPFLRHPRWEIREMAVETLGRLRPTSAFSPLCRSLQDGSPAVRATAIWAVAQYHASEVRGHLRPLLKDPVPAVRYAAQWALAQPSSSGRPKKPR